MENKILNQLKPELYAARLILNKPLGIDVFEKISFDSEIIKRQYDFILIFIFSLGEFQHYIDDAIRNNRLLPNGCLYFVYPKKGNKQYREYIGRDDFFMVGSIDKDGYINDSRLKFNKMCAFNDTFTVIGLKHLEKKETRNVKPSQCVGDYIGKIPELQQYWEKHNPAILKIYNLLSPGYMRDWARYVYSAQTQQTVNRRLLEMENILNQGYKTKDLYRIKKK